MKKQIAEVINCDHQEIKETKNPFVYLIDKTVRLAASTIRDLKYLSVDVRETEIYYELIQK